MLSLNPFPNLLIYSFFVPTLLRVVAAIYFILIAHSVLRQSAAFEATSFPLIGRPKKWMVSLSAALTLLIAFLLFVGLQTQWAAVAALCVVVKHILFLKNYPTIRPFTTATYVLLGALCFTLLISGAGLFAFDVRL